MQQDKDTTKFSYYDPPISNLIPRASINILQAYKVIKGYYFEPETRELRSVSTKTEFDHIKLSKLPYVTFSGIFLERFDNMIIMRSHYFCVDCDHLGDRWQTVWDYIQDNFDPVLMFRSPSGDGIKVVFIIDTEVEHERYFLAFERYFIGKLGIKIDPQCKNISRACFLCHDPEVYLNESARIYGLSFVESFEGIRHERQRTRKPIASSNPGPIVPPTPDKIREIFNKLAFWADHDTPYIVGSRHRHKLILMGALNRQGVPIDQAVKLTYNRCKRSGIETEPIEQFEEMAERIYELYEPVADKKI